MRSSIVLPVCVWGVVKTFQFSVFFRPNHTTRASSVFFSVQIWRRELSTEQHRKIYQVSIFFHLCTMHPTTKHQHIRCIWSIPAGTPDAQHWVCFSLCFLRESRNPKLVVGHNNGPTLAIVTNDRDVEQLSDPKRAHFLDRSLSATQEIDSRKHLRLCQNIFLSSICGVKSQLYFLGAR